MKLKLRLIAVLQLSTICCFSQNIGIGTTTPDASAQLDVTSTTRGMLIPRMTTPQRTSIAAPVRGLLVFDNTTNTFWFYNGTTWTELTSGGSSKWNLNGTNISNNNTGNVGIGTTTPSEKLQVTGNIKADTIKPNAIKLTGQGEALDRVLSTDGSGTATWKGPVGFAVSRTTDKPIATAAEIIMDFNSEQYDPGNVFITDKFTAPHDGLYHFDASINWTVNFAVANCYISLRHNDNIGVQKRRAIQFVSSAGDEPFLSVSATFYMLGSDTVDFRVYQNSGITQTIESTASTYFSGFLVR